MKNVISKNILNAAKIAGKVDHTGFVALYPDGRIVATDSFKLIEIKNGIQEENETLSGLFQKDKAFEIKKPIAISSKKLLEKQKFNKPQHISLTVLENVILTEGDDEEHIKFCSSDIDSKTETIYRIEKREVFEYEKVFPEKPKYIASMTIKFMIELLTEMQKMGIREVDILKGDDSKPFIFQAQNVRGLIMPLNYDDQEKVALNRYEELSKI